ncbi:MAG: hypothetical protein Q4C47_07785 [Planctomycetia bacterium]|nr:hypothetical protein [Planctomycetia bacterium]
MTGLEGRKNTLKWNLKNWDLTTKQDFAFEGKGAEGSLTVEVRNVTEDAGIRLTGNQLRIGESCLTLKNVGTVNLTIESTEASKSGENQRSGRTVDVEGLAADTTITFPDGQWQLRISGAGGESLRSVADAKEAPIELMDGRKLTVKEKGTGAAKKSGAAKKGEDVPGGNSASQSGGTTEGNGNAQETERGIAT